MPPSAGPTSWEGDPMSTLSYATAAHLKYLEKKDIKQEGRYYVNPFFS